MAGPGDQHMATKQAVVQISFRYRLVGRSSWDLYGGCGGWSSGAVSHDCLIPDGYVQSDADLQGMGWLTNRYNSGCK